MGSVRQIAVPEGSLLAGFGGPEDYRDAFAREVPGAVSLEQFITRFYSSAAFAPERLVLALLGRGASQADIAALASGKANRLAVWEVVERRSHSSRAAVGQTRSEVLLESKDTGTASWLAVEALPSSSSQAIGQTTPATRLMFGSWVGGLEQSRWRFMLRPHVLYSRALIGSC